MKDDQDPGTAYNTTPDPAPTQSTEELLTVAKQTHQALATVQEPYEQALQKHKVALFTLIDAFAAEGVGMTEADHKAKWKKFLEDNKDLFPQGDPDYCNRTYTINSCQWVNCMKNAS